MPIEKVEIQHKFGIVSVTHKRELEHKAREQKWRELHMFEKLSDHKSERGKKFQVTENFVVKFNQCKNAEKGQLEQQARRHLDRTKRKVGIRSGGVGSHVDLPQGWKELILLSFCQCRAIQEEALEVLYTSLFISPISRTHVESLLEVGNHIVAWLLSIYPSQPLLRTGEIKMLKVAHLVFVRLLYHELAYDLQDHTEQTIELGESLQAFEDQAVAYRSFPSIAFTLHFLSVLGSYLSSRWESLAPTEAATRSPTETATHLPTDAVTHSLAVSCAPQKRATGGLSPIPAGSSSSSLPSESATFDNGTESREKIHSPTLELSDKPIQAAFSKKHESPVAVSVTPMRLSTVESIYQTCPMLCLALELWKEVSHIKKGIRKAIDELLSVDEEADNGDWIHIALAIFVFAEAASINASVMEALLRHAAQKMPYATPIREKSTAKKRCSLALSQVVSEDSPSRPRKSVVAQDSSLLNLRQFLDLDASEKQGRGSSVESKGSGDSKESLTELAAIESMSSQNPGTESESYEPGTIWSVYEVLTYVQCLGKICTLGNSSVIRQMALEGTPQYPLGLLQLLNLRVQNRGNKEGPSFDLTWEVRHTAAMELVKVATWFRNDTLNEGIKNAALHALLKQRDQEKDLRVLEASKIAQIEAELESLRKASQGPTLFSRLSTNLAIILLPPTHEDYAVDMPRPTLVKRKLKRVPKAEKSKDRDRISRITIGEDIMLNNAVKQKVQSKESILWRTVQDISTGQFEKEALEDEWLRENDREASIEDMLKDLSTQVPGKCLRQRINTLDGS